MSSGVPSNPTSQNVASILPKLSHEDQDIRFMTLNDLYQMLKNGSSNFLIHDIGTSTKVVDGILTTMNDKFGEIQNQSIKCLEPLVNKIAESVLTSTIEKIANLKTDNTLDHTIPQLALRAIVVALPHPVSGVARTVKTAEAYSAISKALIPRLAGKHTQSTATSKTGPAITKGILEREAETGVDTSGLDVLVELAKSFGPMLQEQEIQVLEATTMSILESPKCGSVLNKKAIAAEAALAPYLTDALLSKQISQMIEKLRQPHLTSQQRKLYLSIFGSLAKAVPRKFGPYLQTLAPFVLAPLSQMELDQQREAEEESDGERDLPLEEVREAALGAIESFLQMCPEDMASYTDDVVDASIRFLRYDPTLADDDDDEEMEDEDDTDDFDADEGFEEETGFDDEDDLSWKLRRGSAKSLHALVATLNPSNPAIYTTIAPALLAKFKEREEGVRNEVLAAFTFLISKTGSLTPITEYSTGTFEIPQSRKRRRGGSDAFAPDFRAQQSLLNGYASPSTPPPPDDATASLTKLNPDIIKALTKLLSSSTPTTKLAALTLLKTMVQTQRGGPSSNIDQAIGPALETLHGTQGSGSNVTNNALRSEFLALLQAISETHSSKVLQPHLDKIVPAVIQLARDRFAKVAGEAFVTIESLVKALTPPRSAGHKEQNAKYLAQALAVIQDRVQAQDTDTEIKQKALRALGLLIGRTSGPSGSKLLTQAERFQGQQLLLERMRNELTRLACVRAFDTIATLSQAKSDYKPGLVDEVAVELAAQFRKASRSLRGASLVALRVLVVNTASRDQLSQDTVRTVVDSLVPLLQADDLHMLGPALIILAAIVKTQPALIATPAVFSALCGLTSTALPSSATEALILCVEAIGATGAGHDLMTALLDQGVSGDPDVTGRVIGALLVAGGKTTPVQINDFVKEAQAQNDETRKCLALSVLGESALRMGASCPLKPDNFTAYFDSPSEKVKLAAAIALGRAGAGNVKLYLPQILDAMSQGRQYFLLHSVKELLQHSNAEDDIKPEAQTLWEHIISSGQAEDNKVVSAECIGRLAIIDPVAYLPQLQKFLGNPNATIRAMVMTALRYVFSDTDESYNPNLQSSINSMLSTMLSDTDVECNRLALSAFNSAFQNKTVLVAPHLTELLPYAVQATVIKPELIREVSMGPFKHKVDDGLDIRKSAYETLYGLLENRTSRPKLDIPVFYDRIIAGIGDEHEIKIVSCTILSKLALYARDESIRRLDALIAVFKQVLLYKPKENAVKQELEKVNEQNKAIIRVSISLNKAVSASEESRTWREYMDYLKKEFPIPYKVAEEELKEMRDN